MRLKSISKTQFKLIYFMYNKNQDHRILTNALETNQAFKLADQWPEMFKIDRLTHLEYSFKINNLGQILDLIKYNQKYEVNL